MNHLLTCILIITGTFIYCQTGKVIKVKDGDTIVLLDADNVQHTIRVADIDCPEYKQPYSIAAKEFASDQVYMEYVEIISKGIDRYGRTIGFVMYGNGKDLSRELLKSGLAWHYVKYSTSPTFEFLENMAKKEGRGLWAEKNPVPPWEWRNLKSNK